MTIISTLNPIWIKNIHIFAHYVDGPGPSSLYRNRGSPCKHIHSGVISSRSSNHEDLWHILRAEEDKTYVLEKSSSLKH